MSVDAQDVIKKMNVLYVFQDFWLLERYVSVQLEKLWVLFQDYAWNAIFKTVRDAIWIKFAQVATMDIMLKVEHVYVSHKIQWVTKLVNVWAVTLKIVSVAISLMSVVIVQMDLVLILWTINVFVLKEKLLVFLLTNVFHAIS